MDDSRRDFLTTFTGGLAAATVPYFFSTPRTLADETQAKNDRIALGLIGSGSIANLNIKTAKDWIDVVAIADADAGRAASFNERHAGGKADVYDDYRRILERRGRDPRRHAGPLAHEARRGGDARRQGRLLREAAHADDRRR
jgi:hypothetical protein